jgi:hypothetical protein
MNRWRPVACYPVGVALAHIQPESINLVTTLDRAQQQLNSWCESSNDIEESTIYKYTKNKIEEHLNNLRDLKVYDKNKGFLNKRKRTINPFLQHHSINAMMPFRSRRRIHGQGIPTTEEAPFSRFLA